MILRYLGFDQSRGACGRNLTKFALDEALAKDQGRPDTNLGTGAMTLAQNFPSESEVDVAFAEALSVGATPLKSPEKVFWGGYSGYYADPDGHVWEVAHNPFSPLDKEGYLEFSDD